MSMSDRQVDISTDAAVLGRSMYQELRASDMRYHGAHLLAEYIVQAGRMFEAAAAVTKDNASLLHDLDAQRESVKDLSAMTRFMALRAEANLVNAAESHVKAITDAGSNQLRALKQMLDSLAHAQKKLEATRAALDLQQAALREERLELAAERASFDGLTLWQRVFSRT
jgi:hypothetical protein